MLRNNLIETRFHALPTRNNQAFPIDTSDCAIFDVNYDDAGQKIFHTRKVPYTRETCISPKGLSIPLTLPQYVHYPLDCRVVCNPKYPNTVARTVDLEEQYEWYKFEPRDLHHRGLKDALGKHSIEWEDMKDIFQTNRECKPKLCYGNITVSQKQHHLGRMAKRKSVILECIDDIPKGLVCSLLEEACYADWIDYTHNYSLRNCVAAYGSDYVLYVSGAYSNELVLVKLTTDGTLLDGMECDRVQTWERIFEIRCHGVLVNIRGLYSVTHFKIDDDGQKLTLKELNRLSFDSTIQACAMNPFTKDEVCMVDGKNIAVVSLDGRILHSMENHVDESIDWQNIIYGNSIQRCLLSRKSEILIHDFREKPYTQRQFFDLPSEYFNRYEVFSPALSTSPINNHQYLTATNQALVVIDERYLKTPVMKINHYLDSHPRFIQTHTKLRNDDVCLIALGNYETREIVAMNLRVGHEQEISFDSEVKLKCRTPLQMDGSLIKFSCPNEWSAKVSDWKIVYKSIKSRLNQPCIGFCINNISQSRCHELVLTQENLVGDLFYQKFTNHRGPFHEDQRDLDSASESRCNLWMDTCFKLTHDPEDAKQHRYFDLNKIYKPLMLNLNDIIESSDTESEETPTKKIDTGETSSDSDMDVDIFKTEIPTSGEAIWEKLTTLKNNNQIMTRQTSGFASKISDRPKLVQDPEKYVKPLSQTLLKNWIENEYTPLDVFAPNIKQQEATRILNEEIDDVTNAMEE